MMASQLTCDTATTVEVVIVRGSSTEAHAIARVYRVRGHRVVILGADEVCAPVDVPIETQTIVCRRYESPDFELPSRRASFDRSAFPAAPPASLRPKSAVPVRAPWPVQLRAFSRAS